jgi:outer membrane protein, heavy metal efflux system
MSARSRTVTCVATGVLLVGSLSPASAEPRAADVPPSLSPRAAAEEALRANPELRAAREGIAAARGRLAQAGLWPNLELEVSQASDLAFGNEGERSASVGVSQRLPIAGRIGRARDVARVDVEQAQGEVRDFERTLIGDVESVAVSLLTLDRAIGARKAVIDAASGLVQASTRRLEAAEVSETDLNLLELELARFEQERRLLEIERRNQTIELNRLLYRAPATPLSVAGELDVPIFTPVSIADLLATALRQRPDLVRQRFAQARAQAEVRLARAEVWEDWTLETGYQREVSAIDDRGLTLRDRDNLLGVALRVPLPLWNRNQGRIAEAAANERRAGAEVAALERRIEAEVERESQRVAALEHVVRDYRERLLPRAERNVTLLREGYAQGLSPISALVQAQQQLSETSASYAETLGELRRAEVELETAAAASPLLSDAGSQEPHP